MNNRTKMIFDFYKMESERINERTDWFLIFNAILLEVFFATEINQLQKLSILVFGALVSYIWLVNGIRGWWKYGQLSKKMRDKNEAGEKMSNAFKRLISARKSSIPFWFNWVRDAPSFSIMIPLLCFLLWLFLFCYDIYFSVFSLTGKISIAFGLIILLFVVAFITTAIGSIPKIFRG